MLKGEIEIINFLLLTLYVVITILIEIINFLFFMYINDFFFGKFFFFKGIAVTCYQAIGIVI